MAYSVFPLRKCHNEETFVLVLMQLSNHVSIQPGKRFKSYVCPHLAGRVSRDLLIYQMLFSQEPKP